MKMIKLLGFVVNPGRRICMGMIEKWISACAGIKRNDNVFVQRKMVGNNTFWNVF